MAASPSCLVAATCIVSLISMTGAHGGIGVNYGTLGNNLPSPTEVAAFLKSTLIRGPFGISKVKLFNADPNILSAFANTGIEIIVGISNADLVEIGQHSTTLVAAQWVQSNVAAYLPATRIVGIAVGNEVLGTHDKILVAHIVPAMENLRAALVALNLSGSIIISSPFSLGILHSSVPPSSATFKRPSLVRPMLSFLANTGSPFMANVYPFFAYASDPNPFTLDYALFDSATGYTDPLSNKHYSNMFDAQLDALYSAMEQLGFSNISIMVTETGWPSVGDPNQIGVNMENAETFINNLIKHVSSDGGTPLRPNHGVETFIFALFNENMKPGPTSERNYGLFKPDMTPVYRTAVSDGMLPPSSGDALVAASKQSPSPSPRLPASSAAMASSSSCGLLLILEPFTWTLLLLYFIQMQTGFLSSLASSPY